MERKNPNNLDGRDRRCSADRRFPDRDLPSRIRILEREREALKDALSFSCGKLAVTGQRVLSSIRREVGAWGWWCGELGRGNVLMGR